MIVSFKFKRNTERYLIIIVRNGLIDKFEIQWAYFHNCKLVRCNRRLQKFCIENIFSFSQNVFKRPFTSRVVKTLDYVAKDLRELHDANSTTTLLVLLPLTRYISKRKLFS